VNLHRSIAALLTLLLAAPALPAAEAASLSGTLTLAAGTPAGSVELRLVDVTSGRVTLARTDADGAFRAPVAPGVYSVEAAGYAVRGGTPVLAATLGREASMALVLAPLPPSASELTVEHLAVGCLMAEEHLEIDAAIRPATKVKHARVYFKAARESNFHYVEMAPEIGRFVACLPRPHVDSGPIDYYVEAEADDAGRARTADVSALVIRKAQECPAERRMAVVCPCRVPVAVYDMAGLPAFPSAFGGVAGQLGGAFASQITGTAALVAIGASVVGVGLVLQDKNPASPSR
jgi:hypothetical protein